MVPEPEMPENTRPTGAGPGRGTVIGVLGGIASGKSAVARLLAGDDGTVLDADVLAREALESESICARLVEHFGPDVLGADGRPDRTFLAERVFERTEERRRLEGWIHPLVRDRILAGLAEARALGRERIVLDVPLLLENNSEHRLADLCDFLVFVEVDEEERDRRAVASRHWTPGEVARREAAQMPVDRKRAHAQHVIRNQGTLEELQLAVRETLIAAGCA
jgi:dephospho-CoA kinase